MSLNNTGKTSREQERAPLRQSQNYMPKKKSVHGEFTKEFLSENVMQQQQNLWFILVSVALPTVNLPSNFNYTIFLFYF